MTDRLHRAEVHEAVQAGRHRRHLSSGSVTSEDDHVQRRAPPRGASGSISSERSRLETLNERLPLAMERPRLLQSPGAGAARGDSSGHPGASNPADSFGSVESGSRIPHASEIHAALRRARLGAGAPAHPSSAGAAMRSVLPGPPGASHGSASSGHSSSRRSTADGSPGHAHSRQGQGHGHG